MMKTHNSIKGRDLDWPVSDLGGFRVAVKPNVIIPNCRSSRHSTAASHRMAFSNPSSLLSSCSVHRLNPLLFTHRRQTITLSRWHIHRSRPRFLAGNAIAFFPPFFLFWITKCRVCLRAPDLFWSLNLMTGQTLPCPCNLINYKHLLALSFPLGQTPLGSLVFY